MGPIVVLGGGRCISEVPLYTVLGVLEVKVSQIKVHAWFGFVDLNKLRTAHHRFLYRGTSLIRDRSPP